MDKRYYALAIDKSGRLGVIKLESISIDYAMEEAEELKTHVIWVIAEVDLLYLKDRIELRDGV